MRFSKWIAMKLGWKKHDFQPTFTPNRYLCSNCSKEIYIPPTSEWYFRARGESLRGCKGK
jgi:hypothetical protein